MKRLSGLARQNALLLAWAFIVVEVLVAGAVVVFLMLPLARRSADDLAGLMLFSAQTWGELPPSTRADFEIELLHGHTLALRADLPHRAGQEWHPPFFYLLEEALARRTGIHQHLVREDVNGTTWYWAKLPSGNGWLAVGLPKERIGAHPEMALLIALLGGFVLAGVVAAWLAHRITAPLAQLERAAARIGHGEDPVLLAETGPRELASLARRFNTMAVQVRDLLTARTTLLAGISHDLRTPLARMRLALELLRMQPTPALITRLENDVEEMNGLISTLLDLARGLEREPPSDIDLMQLLNQIALDFATPGREILVRCPSCRRVVPAQALRRAIGNLVQNSLRHAPDAAIELCCEIADDHCRIGVLDRGPGIPPDRVEAMFQPFHRLDPSRSPSTGGFGLGLAIVRELGRANGWAVRLQPRLGGGLAAWIELPVPDSGPASVD